MTDLCEWLLLRHPLMAGVLYVLVVMMAQSSASTFISLPFGMSIAEGTLWFGLTFTLRDVVHAKCGRRMAYITIAVAIAASWAETVLLGVPQRIVLASMVAMAVSEVSDTEVYHANRSRAWLARVLRSNSISIPIDTVVFNLVAFAGVLDWSAMLGLTIGTIVGKALTSAIIARAVRNALPA